jgi:hypothetical protein
MNSPVRGTQSQRDSEDCVGKCPVVFHLLAIAAMRVARGRVVSNPRSRASERDAAGPGIHRPYAVAFYALAGAYIKKNLNGTAGIINN